jgi:hypothetical protein
MLDKTIKEAYFKEFPPVTTFTTPKPRSSRSIYN